MAESSQEIAEKLAADVAKPKRVRTDAGEVERHSARDLIEAAKFVEGRQAADNPFACLRFAQTISPGADG